MKNKASIKLVTKICRLSLFIMVLAISSSQQIALAEDDDAVFEALQIAKHEKRLETSDFALPTTDGEERALSDHKGSVVLLNFWTTW